MKERYRGVKFSFSLDRRPVSHPELAMLGAMGKRLKRLQGPLILSRANTRRAPALDTRGNLSIRCPKGFLVSSTGKELDRLDAASVTLVRTYSRRARLFRCRGLSPPSSETPLHILLYRTYPGIRAILHIHHRAIVRNAGRIGIPVTAHEWPYGTWGLARDAIGLFRTSRAVVVRNHGVFVAGRDLRSAWRTLLSIARRTRRVQKEKRKKTPTKTRTRTT
jgi:hypothetical protein